MAGELGALLVSLGVATQGGGPAVPVQRRRGPAAAAPPLTPRAVTAAEDLGADTVVVHPPFRWQRRYAENFVDLVSELEDERDEPPAAGPGAR